MWTPLLVFVPTKPGISSQNTMFSHPNRAIFVLKANQTISTALPPHQNETFNWKITKKCKVYLYQWFCTKEHLFWLAVILLQVFELSLWIQEKRLLAHHASSSVGRLSGLIILIHFRRNWVSLSRFIKCLGPKSGPERPEPWASSTELWFSFWLFLSRIHSFESLSKEIKMN